MLMTIGLINKIQSKFRHLICESPKLFIFVFSSRRDDSLTVKTKYLVYKGCKKNVHRLWKMNGDGKSNTDKIKSGFSNKYSKSNMFASSLNCQDDEKIKENLRTTEKMNQLKLKMELANARKKLKSIKFSKSKKTLSPETTKKQEIDEILTAEKSTSSLLKVQDRSLSAESKSKIKENISRNRSFKSILNTSPPSSTFLNNNMNTFEVCNKLGRSFSFQSNYVFNRNEKQSQFATLDTTAAISSPTVIETESNDAKCSTSMQDLLLKEFLSPERDYESSKCALNEFACSSGDINEYFILPKLLIRKNSAEPQPESAQLDVAGAVELMDVKQPSSESLVEFCDNMTSSSTSLVSKVNDYSCFSGFPPTTNRFYHSDLDLNQVSERFKTKLSISNQDINTSDTDWPQNSNLIFIPSQMSDETSEKSVKTTNEHIDEVNYDKFLNDLLSDTNNDPFDLKILEDKPSTSVIENMRRYDSNNETGNLLSRNHLRKLPPLGKKPSDKLKSFGSNPVLRSNSNSCSQDNNHLTNSTTTVHIPQLSRLEDVPLFNRRGYINLNDACLSNSDLTTSHQISSDRRGVTVKESSFYRSQFDIPEVNDDDAAINRVNGRQSRFEYCKNSLYSDSSKSLIGPSYSAGESSETRQNFDFQSEENIFNLNIDSFYDDFVDSAEWSSTSSASSISLESSSTSSAAYDKKFLVLPEIKLDQIESVAKEKILKKVEETQEQKEASGKLRCSKCNKKLGLVMVFKCHCEKYFCSTHRYSSTHECTFDYKTHARKILAKENPICVTEKLPKI